MRLHTVAATAVILAIMSIMVSCGPGGKERRLLHEFYAANDSREFRQSLALTSDSVTIDSWAQAINGNHLGTRHLVGRDELEKLLGGRGMCRNFYGPDGPFYTLRDIVVSGAKVSFELRPDRLSATGRPYNLYRGQFTFQDGRIQAITMVEVIGWL